jgi:hypothetical protein
MNATGRDGTDVCPQCGAVGCKEKYGTMLALEFEQPTVFGAVHHITVVCYNLQHPDTFSDEALAWMRSSLRDIIDDNLSGPDLLKRARGSFGGNARVKRVGARGEGHARARWSMTAADVRTSVPAVYVEDVRAWAASILKDLGVSEN